MNDFLGMLGERPSGVDNEYQFIIRKFEQMTTEKYKGEELMQKHQLLLNSLFLSSLLRENLKDKNVIFAEDKRYEVTLEAPVYQVAVLVSGKKNVPDYPPEIEGLRFWANCIPGDSGNLL